MKILIIRLGSLGDVALAGLLVMRLRERFPQSSIDFLTRGKYLGVVEAMPGVTSRWKMEDGRWRKGKPPPPANPSIEIVDEKGPSIEWGRLRNRYDVVIDLQNNLRSRWLTAGLETERVLRYHRSRVNRFVRIHFPGLRRGLKTPLPVAEQYAELAGRLW